MAVEEEAAALQDNEILQAAAAAKAMPNKEKTKAPTTLKRTRTATPDKRRRLECLITARKALVEASDEDMAKELSAKIENLLKQVQNEQKMKQLEAAREQAKTKHAEVAAAKEKARIAIKELTKAEEACEHAEKKAKMMQDTVGRRGKHSSSMLTRASLGQVLQQTPNREGRIARKGNATVRPMEKQLMEAIKKFEEAEAKRQPDAMEDGTGSQE